MHCAKCPNFSKNNFKANEEPKASPSGLKCDNINIFFGESKSDFIIAILSFGKFSIQILKIKEQKYYKFEYNKRKYSTFAKN
jgi:hypothetical protein